MDTGGFRYHRHGRRYGGLTGAREAAPGAYSGITCGDDFLAERARGVECGCQGAGGLRDGV